MRKPKPLRLKCRWNPEYKSLYMEGWGFEARFTVGFGNTVAFSPRDLERLASRCNEMAAYLRSKEAK